MANLSERASGERFLRPIQVQQALGVVASTLWNYVHVRKLIKPATYTAGGHARYRASDVDALKAELSGLGAEAAAEMAA